MATPPFSRSASPPPDLAAHPATARAIAGPFLVSWEELTRFSWLIKRGYAFEQSFDMARNRDLATGVLVPLVGEPDEVSHA